MFISSSDALQRSVYTSLNFQPCSKTLLQVEKLVTMRLFTGQIDSQEVTAKTVFPQRMFRGPRRSPPPYRRGPPPRWRPSPPRYRRR